MQYTEEPSSLRDRAKQKLVRELGDDLMGVLHDPSTIEIMLNADGRLWHERLGEPMRCIGTMRKTQSLGIVKTVAGFHGRELTRSRPTLECEFPLDGSRFAAQVPPVVPEVVFAIRKKAVSVFTLDDYVAAGIMTSSQCALIKEAIAKRHNIILSGGTGSGKTTLANAGLSHISAINPDVRLVIIEDTGEIQCTARNYVQYHTCPEV
ncbi:MAG: ATPase, T2SS/T4P/T4SS family, partial [Nitrosospira sp.]